MTTETLKMDFSKVGGAALGAAVEMLSEGKTEQLANRISWLYSEVLYKRRLTHMGGIERLASWDDEETLRNLSSISQRMGVLLGIHGQNSAVLQRQDIQLITNILKKAHQLSKTPDILEAWVKTPRKPAIPPPKTPKPGH